MNNLSYTVLSLSLSASLLIFILLLFKPIVRDRFSKRWQYYIWLVVIFRLILPFASEPNLMGYIFGQFDATIDDISQKSDAEFFQHLLPISYNLSKLETELNDTTTDMKFTAVNSNILEIVLDNIYFIWIGIAMILALVKIINYQNFLKYIKSGCTEISDIEKLNHFTSLKEKMGIKSTIGFYTNPIVSSPMLFRLFHTYLVLPNLDLSDSELHYTILHELTHYKRYDLFYKFLVQIVVCIHWFNPLVHIMAKDISQQCELSCDESIVQNLDRCSKIEYGNTLINAMGSGGNYKNSAASVTLNESLELLKERLDAIMKFKRKSKIHTAISTAITVTMCLSASIAGAYANTDSSKSQYTQRYNADQTSYLGARGIEGNWACATGVQGDDYQQILDDKLAYIENLYQEENQIFILEEGVSLEEATNFDGIEYMYNSSSIYRKLITPQDIVYIAPESNFDILSDEGQSKTYERHVFYLDNPSTLELSIFYQLKEGKMAVWLVASDGKILYQNQLCNDFDQTIQQPLEKGIYSVILEAEMENGQLSGNKSIQGNILK